jgi:hypothetical protein
MSLSKGNALVNAVILNAVKDPCISFLLSQRIEHTPKISTVSPQYSGKQPQSS